MGALLPGARGQLCGDRFAGQLRFLDGFGRQLLQACFLLRRRRRIDARVVRRAEFRGQFAVMLARILAGPGGDLGRQ